MQQEHSRRTIVALYRRLEDAEAALNAIQDAGVPYHETFLGVHTDSDAERPIVAEPLPDHFWSLAVGGEEARHAELSEILQLHKAFRIGYIEKPIELRAESARGAIAWGHLVFDSPASSDQVGDAAGSSGTTGIINSGAFADSAHVQREPPE